MSKTYIVGIREVHVNLVEVEAESPEEATAAAADGAGDYLDLEFSHTLDTDEWTVEEG